jgi:hypothetical protein
MRLLRDSVGAALIVVSVLSLPGCGGGPEQPSSPNPYVGTWQGTITDPRAGTGAAFVVIMPRDQFFYGGTWRSTFPQGQYGRDGTLAVPVAGQKEGQLGFVVDANQTCLLGPTGETVRIRLYVTADLTPNRMVGSYDEVACVLPPPTTGTIDLRRVSDR